MSTWKRQNILFRSCAWLLIAQLAVPSYADSGLIKSNDKLAAPSIFQRSFADERSESFRQSPISDIKFLSVVFSIAAHFLIDENDLGTLSPRLEKEFENEAWAYELLNEYDINTGGKDYLGNNESVWCDNGVVHIPFEKGNKRYEARISFREKGTKAPNERLEWGLSERFYIRIHPLPDRVLHPHDEAREEALAGSIKLSYSILLADPVTLRQEVERAKLGGLDALHVDHFDGKMTFGDEVDARPGIAIATDMGMPLHVHLWAKEPQKAFIDTFIKAGLKSGRDKIILPYEAFSSPGQMLAIINYIKENGLQVGISLNPETSVSVLDNLWGQFDDDLNTVVIMGVVPGPALRQAFLPVALEKIRSVRRLLRERQIDAIIEGDGGMTATTYKDILIAGADAFSARSLFLKAPDVAERVRSMKEYGLSILNIRAEAEIVKILEGFSFATVAVIQKDGKQIVRKQAYVSAEESLRREIEWLLKLPAELKRYFPEMLQHSVAPGNVYYEMPYMAHMPDLMSRITDASVSPDGACDIMKSVLRSYLKDFSVRQGRTKAPDGFLADRFISKIEKRVHKTLRRAPYLKELYRSKYLTINGKQYRNIPSILAEMKRDHALLEELNPRYLHLVHGDLSLQNILTAGKEFLLVDPDGASCGDMVYDLSKMAQSIFGKLSLLDRGLYDLAISDGGIDFKLQENNPYWRFYNSLEEKFDGVLNDSGMSDYLSEHEPYWRLRMQLMYALNFAGYALFRLDDERKARAFYVQSVILVNDFLDRYNKLSAFGKSLIKTRSEKDAEGKKVTMAAFCPMSEDIISSCIEVAKEDGTIPVFIATPRQVDVEGSYTGWTQKNFVDLVKRKAKEAGYTGPIFIERDHGGPWQRPQDKALSLAEAMKNAKRTYAADLDAGFNILHIDVTMEAGQNTIKIPVEDMINRTVELIKDCEEHRLANGIAPVAYEIGSDENEKALSSLDEIDTYIKTLRARLTAEGLGYVWDNIVYLVIDTGAKISGQGQIGALRTDRTTQAFKIAARYGLYLKQHNSDYMKREVLAILPVAGIAAANIGPETSEIEYVSLDELERTICEKDPNYTPQFMPLIKEVIGGTDRWKRWFKGAEKVSDLSEADQRKLVLNCGRYVQNEPKVQAARQALYEKARSVGIDDPEGFVRGRIKATIRQIDRALISPANINLNLERAVKAVLESDTLAFDVDLTLNRERRVPIAEDAALLIDKFCTGDNGKRKKIRIVTGRPLSKIKDNDTLMPLLDQLRAQNIDADLIAYISDGAGKYKVNNKGEFIPYDEYNRPFTSYEINRIREVLKALQDEIENEQSLTKQGITSIINNEGDIRIEWQAYGANAQEYLFETNAQLQPATPRRTRAELAARAVEALRKYGVTDIDAIVSGGTTIGFVRKGVSKRRAIEDILKEGGRVTFMGDEVGTVTDVSGLEKAGNDNVVGKMLPDTDGRLSVVSMDEVPTGIPPGVIWLGDRCDGTVKLLEKAYFDMRAEDKEVRRAKAILEKYGMSDDAIVSITPFLKGEGIHAPYYQVRTGSGSFVLRSLSTKFFEGSFLDVARYEAWMVNTLQANGIPAVPIMPKTIKDPWEAAPEDSFICQDETGNCYLLYRYIEEDKFNDVQAGAADKMNEAKTDNMIAMLARMHQVLLNNPCPYQRKYEQDNLMDIKKMAKKLRKLHRTVSDQKAKGDKPFTRGERFVWENAGFIADQIEQFVSNVGYFYGRPELRRVGIHGDYTPANVIFKGDEVVGIIDWEHSRDAIMVFDLITLLRPGVKDPKQELTIDNIKRLVFDYNKKHKLTETEIRVLPELFRYKLLDRMSRLVKPWRYHEGVGFDFKGSSDDEKAIRLIDANDKLYQWHINNVNAIWNFTAMLDDGSFEREIVEPLLQANGIIQPKAEDLTIPEKRSDEIVRECLETLKDRKPYSISMRRKLGDISLKELVAQARPAREACEENKRLWTKENNYYTNGWIKVMQDFDILFAHPYAVIYRVPTGNIYIAVRGKDTKRVKDNKDQALIEISLNEDLTINKLATVHPASDYDLSRSSIAIQLTDAEVFDRFPQLEEALRLQLVWQEVDGESRFREAMDARTIELGSLIERAIRSPATMGDKDISNILSLRYIKSKVIRRRALEALCVLYDSGKIPEDNFKNAVTQLTSQDITEDYRVVERAIKYKKDFVRETFKNLFNEDITANDISSVELMYYGQDLEKEVFKVLFNLSGNRGTRVAAISLIRHDTMNTVLSQDSIESSTKAWGAISKSGIDAVPRFGTSYWELDYRARMVNLAEAGSKRRNEKPLVNNIQVVTREFVEGDTLSEILSNKYLTEADKEQAVKACAAAALRLFNETKSELGKGYFIEDPGPGQFVLYKEKGAYRVKIIDLDRLVEFPDADTVLRVFNRHVAHRAKIKALFVNMADKNAPEVRPPLAIAYLTSAAKEHFQDRLKIDILDVGLQKDDVDIERRISEKTPDVVCISIPASALLENAVSMAKRIKEARPEALIIVGGIHPSVDPEGTMAAGKCFDILVKGEGEQALIKILEAVSSGQDLADVKGIAFRSPEGQIVNTDEREIVDIEELPRDVFSQLALEDYHLGMTEFSGEKFLPVTASRGCAYRCRFCSYAAVTSGKVRYKTPERMVSEIEGYIKKYDTRNFFFSDDTFTLKRDFVENFCKLIIERGITIRWRCFTRADKVDKELLALMRRAGCIHISYGLESADPRVLEGVDKKCSMDDYRNACRWSKENGIRVKLFLMLGLPFQSVKSVDETLDFLREIRPEEIDPQYFVPYPGAEFAREPSKWGLTVLETDLDRYRQRPGRNTQEEVMPVLKTDWMTRDEIRESRARILREFEKISQHDATPHEGIASILAVEPAYTSMILNRDGNGVIRKQASLSGEAGVRREIGWMLTKPAELKQFDMKQFVYSLAPGNVYYEMSCAPADWDSIQNAVKDALQETRPGHDPPKGPQGAAKRAFDMLPHEWHFNKMDLEKLLAELTSACERTDPLKAEKSGYVFSERVTFDNGLGILLPKLAAAGLKIAVIARTDKQIELINDLNAGKSEDEKIKFAETVAEAAAKVRINSAKTYYFKVQGDPNPGIEGITTIDITAIAKKIIDMIGNACGIVENVRIQMLKAAAQRFA